MSARRQLTLASSAGALAAMAATAFACGSFSGSEANGDTDGGAADAIATGEGGSPTDAPLGDGSDPGETGAAPFEIANGLDDLQGIAVTDSTVYVVEHTRGHVRAISINGGPITDIDTNAGSPLGIAVVDNFVFWADSGGANLHRWQMSNGAKNTISLPSMSPVAIATAADRIVVLAIDKTNVGVAQQYTLGLLAGSAVGALGNLFDVTVLDGSIYWTESNKGRIGKGVFGAVTNETFATAEGDCQSIASDASGVYWTRRLDGLIRTQDAAGTGVRTVASNELEPHSVVADGASVYWMTTDGKLRAQSHTPGTPPRTLASNFGSDFDQLRARALAYNAKYLVWMTTDGRILRIPR